MGPPFPTSARRATHPHTRPNTPPPRPPARPQAVRAAEAAAAAAARPALSAATHEGAARLHSLAGAHAPGAGLAALRAALGGPEGPRLAASRADNGATPMHVAAGAGRLDVLELLLRVGGDPRAVDGAGRGVPAYAARAGEAEALEWALRAGADPNVSGGPAGPQRAPWQRMHTRHSRAHIHTRTRTHTHTHARVFSSPRRWRRGRAPRPCTRQ